MRGKERGVLGEGKQGNSDEKEMSKVRGEKGGGNRERERERE